jgi:hypothetical protein
VMDSAQGQRIFCVATPGAGGQQSKARTQQEQWVLDMVKRSGGATKVACGSPPEFSDQRVQVVAARTGSPSD